ncbi:unnamed protein product [Vitrella brassicaformis CCMP3155]|uniref:Anaphase-promoting complex subunit 4 WD40 domain-containing protein n=2 Tax=Vitrella brassicaformis TaxID=1169539 RepID=A0A0G4G4Z0_VITBC|nr:unnamed protein product [Vitrella brassicaformis CCMP3155]|mmetsp:Transcript_35797/g.102895  ORF Transcript_35797/g.102895 Transcript_35797/m.102895 type:complete len:331 (+) Transcript_35797:75-1067(+)|eukprot:CEM23494.1 unnamed protein product [Vitrella brassicaformis CCMP3155]
MDAIHCTASFCGHGQGSKQQIAYGHRDGSLTALAVNEDGRSVVKLFSLPHAHTKPVLATAFHSATNRLISAAHGRVHVWNWQEVCDEGNRTTGEVRGVHPREIPLPESSSVNVALAIDTDRNHLFIAASTDGSFIVHDLNTPDVRKMGTVNTGGPKVVIHEMKYVPGQTKQLVTASEDGCLRFFDPRSGAHVSSFTPATNAPTEPTPPFAPHHLSSVDCDPLGHWLVAGGGARMAFLYTLPTMRLIAAMPTMTNIMSVRLHESVIFTGHEDPFLFKWAMDGSLLSEPGLDHVKATMSIEPISEDAALVAGYGGFEVAVAANKDKESTSSS